MQQKERKNPYLMIGGPLDGSFVVLSEFEDKYFYTHADKIPDIGEIPREIRCEQISTQLFVYHKCCFIVNGVVYYAFSSTGFCCEREREKFKDVYGLVEVDEND